MFLVFCWNLVEVSKLELVVGFDFQCSAQCVRPMRRWGALRKPVERGTDPCVPGAGQGGAGPCVRVLGSHAWWWSRGGPSWVLTSRWVGPEKQEG